MAELPKSPTLILTPGKPGINRELTRYGGEGGWYDADKVRFRYGQPEKIGRGSSLLLGARPASR